MNFLKQYCIAKILGMNSFAMKDSVRSLYHVFYNMLYHVSEDELDN